MCTSLFTSRLQKIIIQTRREYFNIPEYILSEKEKTDKWSKREILGHLIDSARYNLMRFTEIPVTEDIYKIRSYKQDQLVKWQEYQTQNDHHLISMWQLLNHQIIGVISNFTVHDLNKPINIKDEIKTLEWLIEDYILHLEHHINQIFCKIVTNQPTPTQITLSQAKDNLIQLSMVEGLEFVTLLTYADLEIEYYQPNKKDKQQPHLKDEVYVIISGTGFFSINGLRIPIAEHDVLFVKAGDKHRFVDFTENFATWVIFFGVRNGKV